MEPNISIVPLQPQHLSQVESWNSSQNITKALLKLPDVSLSPTSDTHGWAALKGDEVVAIATVRLNKEHVGYLECVVKPSARRRGVGSNLVSYVLKQPVIDGLQHLHALVDHGNIPAQKTLDEQGFTRTGYAEDGRIEFARHKYQSHKD